MSRTKEQKEREKYLTSDFEAALEDENDEALNQIYKEMDRANGYDICSSKGYSKDPWKDDFEDEWD